MDVYLGMLLGGAVTVSVLASVAACVKAFDLEKDIELLQNRLLDTTIRLESHDAFIGSDSTWEDRMADLKKLCDPVQQLNVPDWLMKGKARAKLAKTVKRRGKGRPRKYA